MKFIVGRAILSEKCNKQHSIALFFTFTNLFNTRLTEDGLVSFYNTFNPLHCVMVVEGSEENLLAQICSWEVGCLIVFSEYGYFSRILDQNSPSGSFLKVSHNVESKSVTMNSYSVPLKSVGQSCN